MDAKPWCKARAFNAAGACPGEQGHQDGRGAACRKANCAQTQQTLQTCMHAGRWLCSAEQAQLRVHAAAQHRELLSATAAPYVTGRADAVLCWSVVTSRSSGSHSATPASTTAAACCFFSWSSASNLDM